MRRVSRHWVHNVAQGARCKPGRARRRTRAPGERAAHALGMDYAGVDIVPAAGAQPLLVLK